MKYDAVSLNRRFENFQRIPVFHPMTQRCIQEEQNPETYGYAGLKPKKLFLYNEKISKE
jgi:hypothetical protein